MNNIFLIYDLSFLTVYVFCIIFVAGLNLVAHYAAQNIPVKLSFKFKFVRI